MADLRNKWFSIASSSIAMTNRLAAFPSGSRSPVISPGQLTIVGIPTVAKYSIVIDIQSQGSAMPIKRLLLAFVSLTSVLPYTSYGAEPPKQTKNNSANASRAEKKPVHLVVRSRGGDKTGIYLLSVSRCSQRT